MTKIFTFAPLLQLSVTTIHSPGAIFLSSSNSCHRNEEFETFSRSFLTFCIWFCCWFYLHIHLQISEYMCKGSLSQPNEIWNINKMKLLFPCWMVCYYISLEDNPILINHTVPCIRKGNDSGKKEKYHWWALKVMLESLIDAYKCAWTVIFMCVFH